MLLTCELGERPRSRSVETSASLVDLLGITAAMPDPLDRSRRKIARAEEHFVDLQRELAEFMYPEPYERVVEPHQGKPDHVLHKIKLTRQLPNAIADITADIVQNLRVGGREFTTRLKGDVMKSPVAHPCVVVTRPWGVF
jgi:hypothetical protein